MAEAIYNKMTGTKDAISAGTYAGAPDEPEGQILKNVDGEYLLNLMEQNGMNIRDNLTKRLTPKMLAEADLVVSMAEEPYIPDFLKNDKRVIWWGIDNPTYSTPEFIEETYEKLNNLILGLIKNHSKKPD